MAVLYQKPVLDMIKEFRRNWHTLCNSERTTVCGADFMLLALQLSMAENNKQHRGEFTVSLSDVLLTWKYLLHDKLNLPLENMEAVDHYEDIRKTYDDFLKNSNMLDLIDVYKKCRILTSNCEQNDKISSSQLRDFLSGSGYAGDDKRELSVPTSPTNKHNQDNEKLLLLAKKIIYSYLSLLVNSKNDLALAHVLNIPDRGLGREAFTDLKHAAREKQTSIFLVATSFIRTLQLGGKGYAPSLSDPLRTHVKGLSNFISFIDKLVEILGETPDPSLAGSRILSVIKTQLIKGQDSRDLFCKVVEEVAQNLNLRIKNIISSQQSEVALHTTDISPARPKSHAINHGTAYCGRETVKALLVLLDEDAADVPTKNKAELLYDDENIINYNGTSLLTLFRSPSQVNNSSAKSLRERIQESLQEKKTKVKQSLIRSQFACTYKDDTMINRDKWTSVNSASEPWFVLPMDSEPSEGVNSSAGRPTIGTSSGNTQLDQSKNKKISRKSSTETGNKNSKRKQVDLGAGNIPCDKGNELLYQKNAKIAKTTKGSQNKSDGQVTGITKGNKGTTKDRLITGQTKLTQFFRL
ncbi:PREDICTED: PCNA-interacting partner [Elephantulus edwardii]|uniref:PCNA-interacting partner n=1 Tax=Elephantulus edwardii TaxID=28737 RepID=UPI0003F06DBF|nr:PREDICTED: PCNA-interacting partner [Elephantulus edwardii]